MTVSARNSQTANDTCVWDITFVTNTGEDVDNGELPLMMAGFYDVKNSSYGILSSDVAEVPPNYAFKL